MITKEAKKFKQDLSSWDISGVENVECISSSISYKLVKNFDFKKFENKIENMEHQAMYRAYRDFEKEKLIDYIKMYKGMDKMAIKVLETLDREKIVAWIKNEMPSRLAKK